MQNAGKRSQESSLSQARYTLQQYVSAGKQADQNAVDNILLSHDDLADFFTDALELSGSEL
jgi:hypothetical protein